MTQTWFITGTDTDVGKTVASSALLQAANLAGKLTAGYKPIASGADLTAEGLRNHDALTLQANSRCELRYAQVNPLTFAEPTAPHIASKQSMQPIDTRIMDQGLITLQQQADWIVVEGAGGWFTPLTEQWSFADWVIAQQLPVILVVGMKLGCINHALLTQAAVEASGLTLAGWVANSIQPEPHRYTDYLITLKSLIKAPLLGEIPYLTEPQDFKHLGDYLRLPELD